MCIKGEIVNKQPVSVHEGKVLRQPINEILQSVVSMPIDKYLCSHTPHKSLPEPYLLCNLHRCSNTFERLPFGASREDSGHTQDVRTATVDFRCV